MSTDTLASRLNRALAGTQFAGNVHHFPTVDSTQTRALADAAAGIAPGQVYLADEQTAGRGRGGHTWQSDPDRGLYLTALVHPRIPAHQVLQLSLAAGLAAQHAVAETTAIPLDLRWPNDLVLPTATGPSGAATGPSGAATVPSLKVGGILTETATTATGTVRYAAIGIGINLNQQEFPRDLALTATSLRLHAGHPIDREPLAIALLRSLDRELDALDESSNLLDRFAHASSWVHGKAVTVAEDDGYTGLTAGLTAEGLLRVQLADGTTRVVRHGGVREA